MFLQGDMFTITIPDGFELVGNIAESQLDEASGIDVTWELIDNVINIRFYQSLDTLSNVSGYMSIGCWFDKDTQMGQDGQDITFVIAGQIFTVDVYYDDITDAQSAQVTKEATYNSTNKEVTWTITVTPDSSNSTLKGVKVEDQFDTNVLGYIEGSFTVDGASVTDDQLVFLQNGFEYTFPTDVSTGAKTITYKTKVKDSYFLSNSTTVNNNVLTFMPNGDKSSEAEAEIAVQKLPMQKEWSDYNAVDHTISWKVVANRNKLSLNNAILVDVYPEGSIVNTDTIKVNGQATTNYTIVESNRTININLGNINDVVTITYEMELIDLEKFTEGKSYIVTNYASLNFDRTLIEEITKTASIGVGTGKVAIEKSGEIRIHKVYGQYIGWTVTINKNTSTDYQAINDPIEFYDKLPEGTSMFPQRISVTAYFPDGSRASKSYSLSDVYNSKTNEIRITFNQREEFSGGKKLDPLCY